MGGKTEAPPAPDYSPLIKMATTQAKTANKLQKKQFQWAKSVYAENKATTDKIVQSQLDSMALQRDQAKKSYDRYENVAIPLRDDFIAKAKDYNSEQRRESEAGAAQANVARQYDQARDANLRELESFGINPTATRYAALDLAFRTGSAAAQAAAGNVARKDVEKQGNDMLAQAINMESTLPGQAEAQLAGANSSGGSAANTALGQTASGANTMGTSTQYMGAGTGAIGTAGAISGQQDDSAMKRYQAQVDQENGVWQGIGSAIGLAAGLMLEDGGVVPVEASPSRGAIPDDVHAKVTAGEFVIPEEVVRWKGEEFFHRFVAKNQQDRAKAGGIPAGGAPRGGQQAIPIDMRAAA